MAREELLLMAHLMRRAGFGATIDELEARAAIGYEATVEDLLNPEAREPVDFYEFLRYLPLQWEAGHPRRHRPVGLGLAHDQHRDAPSGEDVPVLAPDLRNRRLEGRSLRRDNRHDRRVPGERARQIPRSAVGRRSKPRDALLARQPRRTTPPPSTRTGGANCSSCSRWASATTPSGTSMSVLAPSPGGQYLPSFLASTWAASTGISSTAPTTMTTASRRSSDTRATSMAKTS